MISIVCVTKPREHTLEFLHQFREYADELDAELVIGLDGESDIEGDILEIANVFVQVESRGFLEDVLNEVTAKANGDWILRLDDDESMSPAMLEWIKQGDWKDDGETVYSFPCATLWPTTEKFITDWQFWPDYHPRFTIKSAAMGWEKFPHAGAPFGLGTKVEALHYHHKLLVKSLEKRMEIVAEYESNRESAGLAHHRVSQVPDLALSSIQVHPVGTGHVKYSPSHYQDNSIIVPIGYNRKRALVILGPESGGTRMLTEFFVRGGYFGNYGHAQEMDDFNFEGKPDKIVFRRSLPHAGRWPDIKKLQEKIRKAGYSVDLIYIQRCSEITAMSQVRRGHEPTIQRASVNIAEANHLISDFKAYRIKYENFVEKESYRRQIAESFEAEYPEDMVFFNANKKYEVDNGR